jgi:hypothetical protein
MENIKNRILAIGNAMVKCGNKCDGICNDPLNGILPRCLFFDERNSDIENGCVIIGINPGKGGKNSGEAKFYREHGNTYSAQLQLWATAKKANYYWFLEDFAIAAGWIGPILWTELVKCECSVNYSVPPLQTSRNCTKRYLTDELNVVPANWPLIAVGRETHRALAYLYPERSVLGVPHPTSSRGQFANLFSDSKRQVFTDEIVKQLGKFKSNYGMEHWLSQNNE